MPKITKLNESFSLIQDSPEALKDLYNFFKVEREGAYFEEAVKRGFKSPYTFYSNLTNDGLIVMNGLLQLLPNYDTSTDTQNSTKTPFSQEDIEDFLGSLELPFKPYDYQVKGIIDILQWEKSFNKFCTGSGKSLIISCIAEFFRRKNLKGVLLVPNINLLTQFHADIKSYNLKSLHENTKIIGGDVSVKNIQELDKALTISTWQSMQNFEGTLDGIDYVIVDECHKFASDITSQIIQKTVNAKYKYGFTGTVPDSDEKKLTLIGLFGKLKTHITLQELIELGLGTPIHIKSIILNYTNEVRDTLRAIKTYQSKYKYLKEYEPRTKFVAGLANKLSGNTLVLFSHTQHGEDIFKSIFRLKYPEYEGEILLNGKKSYEFQKEHNVYFINGKDDAKTRERTRKILEETDNAILVSNYAILSTGVNIRNLHNMVFGSPVKSYTTISQSIGRLVRLHKTKSKATVYDVVDDLGIKKPTGVFWSQYQERLSKSYNTENLPVQEVFWGIK